MLSNIPFSINSFQLFIKLFHNMLRILLYKFIQNFQGPLKQPLIPMKIKQWLLCLGGDFLYTAFGSLPLMTIFANDYLMFILEFLLEPLWIKHPM